ncbi:MAG: hypothetical protein HXO47_05490 [Prevotella sp.]|nr:hypothetical protein [Prevotella sp.]
MDDKSRKLYGIKLSTQYGQKRTSVLSRVVGLRILIDYFLYPTNNSNRTQRRSTIVPSEWVGVYPTNGYDATQQLGTRLPNRWV